MNGEKINDDNLKSAHTGIIESEKKVKQKIKKANRPSSHYMKRTDPSDLIEAKSQIQSRIGQDH
jgi:hypothetical protein